MVRISDLGSNKTVTFMNIDVTPVTTPMFMLLKSNAFNVDQNTKTRKFLRE